MNGFILHPSVVHMDPLLDCVNKLRKKATVAEHIPPIEFYLHKPMESQSVGDSLLSLC